MAPKVLDQQQVFALVAGFTGQASILTIPRPFIDWTGDHITAMLLSQIIYWSPRTNDPDGWFYKTAREWREELAISDFQLKRATDKLISLGVIEMKLKKVAGAPTGHYRVDQTALVSWISEKLGNGNPNNLEMEIRETQKSNSEKLRNANPTLSGMVLPESADSLTETTSRDLKQDGLFEVSKRPTSKTQRFLIAPHEREVIDAFVADFGRLLHDDAPASSQTRAARLYANSGLTLEEFVDVMNEAKRRTQARSASIRSQSSKGKGGQKAKMGYWFSVVENLCAAEPEVGSGD